MLKTRVAVLRGGPSAEYDMSLQTGASVLKSLPEKYHPIDVLISKDGAWYRSGVAVLPYQALKDIDVVFNALHGAYGEDGKVQRDLDAMKIPYTGSGSIASAIGMNKILAKKRFEQEGIKTPLSRAVDGAGDLERQLTDIFRTMPHPVVIKPSSSGSSLGVSISSTFEESLAGVKEALRHSPQAIVEEYIKGREATCGVVENYREHGVYALFPIEIIPKDNPFYNYQAKYEDETVFVCPALFSHTVKRELEALAIKVHKALDLRHYSRTDFIVSPKRGIYALETNTLPGLNSHSLIPKSLNAVGFAFPDFLDHVLQLALTSA